MKEFIKKLNEKLTYLLNNFGEHCEEWGSDKEGDCHRKSCSDCVLTHAIEIVNQLAEEYKQCNKPSCKDCEVYDKGKHYCPKWCDVIKHTTNELAEEYNNELCEWKSEKDMFIKNPHTGRKFSNEPSMRNVYCNTCGRKIKVVERYGK